MATKLGINDLPRGTVPSGKYKGKVLICPIYTTWQNMLKRCYMGGERRDREAKYEGCEVHPDWHYLSKFKSWVEQQDWEGKHLDKDILVKGNKLYSEHTCVFVHPLVNTFFNDHGKRRGNYPLGVHKEVRSGKYIARCGNPLTGKRKYLGRFEAPEEAHLAWKTYKDKVANDLANSEFVTDDRVKQALINWYK